MQNVHTNEGTGAVNDRLAIIFKALASSICRRIIEQLRKQPRYVTELAGELNIAQSNISKALTMLMSAGIVMQLPRRTAGTTWRCQLYALTKDASAAVSQMERAALLIA